MSSPPQASCRRGATLAPAPAPAPASAAELDVLQDAEGVGDQHGGRVVGADQVGHDRLVVDAHEPDRQARLVLVGNAGLVQAYHALVLLAGPHDQDRGGAAGADRQLVAGEQRDAPPVVDPAALHLNRRRVDPPAVAFAAERGDGVGMGEEEVRLAPPAEQLVEVVGVGGPVLVEIRWRRSALWSKPKSRLLTSSCSWRSRSASMVRRSCCSTWSIGLLYRSATRLW